MVRFVEFKDQDALPFDIVDDVQQYMKNDPKFYRKIYYPTMCKMQEAMKGKGEAKDLIAPMIVLASRGYVEQYKINKKAEELLTSEELDDIVNRVYEDEIEALRQGEY
jgi:hypothetical protein